MATTWDLDRDLVYSGKLPTKTLAITILAGVFDVAAVMAPYARRVYVGVGGDVYIQRKDDLAPVKYKAVPQGTYIEGPIIAIGGTTLGTTATDLVLEQ